MPEDIYDHECRYIEQNDGCFVCLICGSSQWEDYEIRQSVYEFPVTNDIQIAAGYAELASIERRRHDLCEDPMSGFAPVEDFMEDYDRLERKVLGCISRRAKLIGDKEAVEFCNGAFEKWMP